MFFKTNIASWKRYEDEARMKRKALITQLNALKIAVVDTNIETNLESTIQRTTKEIFQDSAMKPPGLPRGDMMMDFFAMDVSDESLVDNAHADQPTRTKLTFEIPALTAQIKYIPCKLEDWSTQHQTSLLSLDCLNISRNIYNDYAQRFPRILMSRDMADCPRRHELIDSDVFVPSINVVENLVNSNESNLDPANKIEALNTFDGAWQLPNIGKINDTILLTPDFMEVCEFDDINDLPPVPFLFEAHDSARYYQYEDKIILQNSLRQLSPITKITIQRLTIDNNLSCWETALPISNECHTRIFTRASLECQIMCQNTPNPSSIFDHPILLSAANMDDALFPLLDTQHALHIQQLPLIASTKNAFLDGLHEYFHEATTNVWLSAVSHSNVCPRISPSAVAILLPLLWTRSFSTYNDVLFKDIEENESTPQANIERPSSQVPTDDMSEAKSDCAIIGATTNSPKRQCDGDMPTTKRLRKQLHFLEKHNPTQRTELDSSRESITQEDCLHLEKVITETAKPLIWGLSTRRLLLICASNSECQLKSISLGSLRSKLQGRYMTLKQKKRTLDREEMCQLARDIRDLSFVHTLRLMLDVLHFRGHEECAALVQTCLSSSRTEKILGNANTKRLRTIIAKRTPKQESAVPVAVTPDDEFSARTPFNIFSNVDMPLDEALETLLCADEIFSIHARELDNPLTLIVGTQVGLCIFQNEKFLDEQSTKCMAFQLAQLQHQLWVVLGRCRLNVYSLS
ncbi:hypothetical protein AC1031_007331 [Aphanomyces cochlioides]|nr:hypothetical protein AC1031_007331 [Aphanomyces cochlioides]